MRTLTSLLLAACWLAAIPSARAELNDQERKEASKMVSGKFFMRLDAPCIYGAKTEAGLWFNPLLEVSPTGHVLHPVPQLTRKQYVYWGSGPNDPVGLGTVRVAGETVYVWIEGRKPASNEFVIKFVNIKNLDDFKAAWARAFSPVPLHEEHSEWPSAIRNAIAEHRVVQGMTKEQAFCVVGAPMSVETVSADTEIWHPRQINGSKQPYHGMKDRETGYPAALKFVGGKLVSGEIGDPGETTPEPPARPERLAPPAPPAPPSPPAVPSTGGRV